MYVGGRPLNGNVRSLGRVRASWKVAVGTLAVIGAAAVLFTVLAPFLLSCEIVTLAKASAPSAPYVAVVENHECKDPAKTGLFVFLKTLDGSHLIELMRAPTTTSDIRLTWRRDGGLLISHPESLPVQEGAPEYDGIKIYIESFPVGGS